MLPSVTSRLPQAAYQYAKSLSVPVTQNAMTRLLEENPYYPSLFSLNNVYSKLQIPNQSLRIDADQLHLLEAPFIAYVKDDSSGHDFVLVTANENGFIQYIGANNKIKKVTREAFAEQWTNIAFVAEKTDKSGDPNYQREKTALIKASQKKRALIAGAVVTILMAMLLLGLSAGNSLFTALSLLFIKTIGVTAAVLLLVYDMDKTNSLVKAICSVTKQTDCDAVLKSKASKIFGLSWAEAGFFYFSATTLFLLFPGITLAAKITWLALANACAAPYILFSIYYQWKVVKQWCPLCLSVQAVLAMELLWSLFSFWTTPHWDVFQLTTVIAVCMAVALPVIVWFTVKPLLLQQKSSKAYKTAYKRMLYNTEIFMALLNAQKQVEEDYANVGITIGNPAATHTIVKVCNPYCGPCAKAHPQLEEIIHKNNDVNIRIIFTAPDIENDRGAMVVSHLMAIAEKGNPQQLQQALDDWYLAPQKNYESFAAKYPMNGELKKQGAKLTAMSNWCKAAGITYTPTIFVNGKLLPETYNLNELQHIF